MGLYNQNTRQWIETDAEPTQAHIDMGFIKLDAEPQESIDFKAQAEAEATVNQRKQEIKAEIEAIEKALLRPMLDGELYAGIPEVDERKARRMELQNELATLG